MPFKHKLSRRLALLKDALLVVTLVALACTVDQGPLGPRESAVGPEPAPSAATGSFGHVVVVVEENTDCAAVIGSSSMPYLNGLAQQYGLATEYYANTHPSIGNYFMMTVGAIITNNDGYSTIVSADNVVRELLAAGKTWKSYAENLPSVGYTGGDVGGYARKHNTIALLSAVVNDPAQRQNLVPFTQFATDLQNNTLPSYSFIAPNLCNDAHDCSLDVADRWLRQNIDPLVQSATFQQDGLLIITFDEAGGDGAHGGGRIAWVVVSPKAKRGYRSATLYQHESTLRLSLKALGVTAFPNAAATAPDMDEFLVTGTSVPVASVAISPASADIQVGQTVQVSAAAKDSNGNVLTGRPITWASSNPAVAVVNASGLVTGVAAGTATVTVTSE